MFQFMRSRTRSAKGRPNCTRPALEEFETRDVPAAHAATAGLALGATAPTAAVVTQATTNGSTNGAAGQMPAMYEGTSVTVNMKEMPKNASASTIAKNQSINTIYAYADLDEEQPFQPVINAIQGEGFNPLWHQVLISFNAGFTPHQFASEADVQAAAAAGEITLTTTDEVYRCAVVSGSGRNA